MMKRLTALLLAFAMLLSVMPGMTLGVSAAGESAQLPANLAVCSHTEHDATWTELDWSGNQTISADGNYYITATDTSANTCAVTGTVTINAGVTATICLNGVTVTGTKQKIIVNGTLNLCDCMGTGGLTGGSNTSNGAAISVRRGCTFNLCGGSIYDNHVTNTNGGGAIYIQRGDGTAGGIMNMYGGHIYGNSSAQGGAIWVGGSKTENIAVGQFHMYGGKITGNYTTNNGSGGAIYAENNTYGGGQVSIQDGVISGNTAANLGGGIYVHRTAELSVSGSTVIAGNTGKDGAAQNVYFAYSATNTPNSATLTVGDAGLTADAWIGVGASADRFAAMSAFGSGITSDYTANFFMDNVDYGIAYENNELRMTNAPAVHEHCICGKDDCTDTTHGAKVNFKPWNDPFSLPESGNWYLVKDVKMSEQVTIAAETTLNLCLNGKTVTAAKGARHVYVSGTFNLTDHATEMGMLTGGHPSTNGGSVYVDYNNATFNLWNGKLYDNNLTASDKTGGAVYIRQATTAICGGVFNMYGGEILENSAPNAGAVMVSGHSSSAGNKEPYSQFNMYGGKISGNTASANGAAIYTQREGAVNLQGGIIEGNTATGNGGAVYASASAVHVGNVEISNNSATKYGGIYLSAAASLTASGSPLIASNTGNNVYLGISNGVGAMITVGAEGLSGDAWIGVGMSSPRVFSTALGGNDYSDNFFSDNTDYSVALENDTLVLTTAAAHEHCICGVSGCTDTTHGAKVTFKAWNDPYSLPPSGDYVLMTDVTLDALYNMGTANLCLNGHTVTQTAEGKRHFTINKGATVSITDCSAAPGGFTADKVINANIIGVSRIATLNLWNGKLYGNTTTEGGAVNVNQANATERGGVFNMYGGEISGNTATNAGGAIIIPGHDSNNYSANVPYAEFNMYGGKITGNTATNDGGVIYAHREAKINLAGGTIESNTAGRNGGAVFANNSTVTVSGTFQFNENTAEKGGAIYGSGGTAITVTGGSFTENKATTTADKTGGGAIYTDSKLTVSGASFNNNESKALGGAIYLHETAEAELTNVTFTGNSSALNGGAVSSRFCPVTTDGCVFEGNTAGGNGGALQGNNAKLSLKNSTFTDNTSGGNGGAIYASSNQAMEMTGCTVTNNTAKNAGAMALYGGQWTITDTAITGNTAENSGAGAVYLRYSSYGKNTTTLAGTTTITGNKEGGSTRNIYMANEDTGKEPYLIIAEDFSGNVGIYMPSGRADAAELAYISSNPVASTTGFYSDNTNYTVTLKDERLYMQWGHSHCICGVAGCTEHEQVRFKPWSDATKLPEKENYYLTVDVVLTKQALIDAGDTLNLCLCGHTVTQTVAGQKHIEIGKGATVSITDCQETVGGFTSTVEANVAAITVARNGGTLNLWNGKIYGNTGKEGAAVSVFQAQGSEKGAVFNMYGGEISGNKGTNVAGAVMISGHNEDNYDATLPYSEFNMYGGKISGNIGVNDGGAIYAQREAKVNLVAGIIENNTTEGEGGAVFASNSIVTIGKDMQITGNTAKNAGAVYVSGGTQLTVSGGKITGNTATVNGGGLYSTGSKTVVTVSGGEISSNKAGNAGGGMIVETKSTFNLTGGTITGNTATYGGGIYVNNSAKFNMTGGQVTKNTSEKTGGGIYMIGSSTGVLSGGKILENTAGTNGGGMYITGSGTTATLNGVTIQKNIANGKGGGVYIYSSAKQLNVSGNTVITDNKAAGKTSNLHLQGARVLELGTMGEKAKVGITVDGVARVISSKQTADYSANFTSDLSTRTIVFKDGVLQLQVSGDHNHCLCAANVTACDHTAVVWEAWDDATSLPIGGNYYLTVDVQMTKAIEVSEELNLCLNGHTVKAGKNTYHIQVAQGGKLAITDCAKDSGMLTGGNRSGSGGSIRVARGAEFNLYRGKLTGNKATTDGGAVYVWMGTKDGDGGVFNMYGGEIYENRAVNGGGVCIGGASDGAKPGTFNLYGGTIRNNSSTSGGGGIYVNDGGQFTMTDGIVQENSSKYGGGIYLNGATATLSGGEVKGNMAKYQVTVKDGKEEKSGGNGGGVYIRASEATLSGVYIYENTADAAGGGICTARITSTVNGETVSRVSDITMTGGKIYNNAATHAGGALIQSMATFTMKDGAVSSNTASNSKATSGNGGGLYVNNATLNMEGGVVETNTAVSSGGGIYAENKAQLNISGGEILTNTAKYGGGVAQMQSTAELSGGIITKNNATANGGGLYVRAAEAKLSGIVITENIAKTNGGGICTARVTETVDGVEKEYTSTIEMTGGEVSKNKAVNGGGALIQSKTVFTMKDGTISGNTSANATGTSGQGGGIYVSTDSFVNMEGGTIERNTAKGSGGGIYGIRSVTKLTGGTIRNNKAKYGGGVYAYGAEMHLLGVTISGNSAEKTGGGVSTGKATVTSNGVKTEYYSKIVMTGGSVSNNSSESNAGGMLIQSKATLIMTGGTVSGNSSGNHGGGIYMAQTENTIRNALISGNKAVKNGAGLYLSGAKLDIQNTRIVKNVAEASGGAMCTSKSTTATDKGYKEYFYPTLTMSGCTIEENHAKTAGGIVLQSNTVADISKTTFTGNTADSSCGALYISSSTNTITDCVFTANVAEKQGGAVFAGSNESNSTFTNCSFTDNSAGTDGGGIFYRANAEFIGCTVTGNKAGASGGGIGTGKNGSYSNFQDGVRIYDSKIDGNTAGTQGGGLYLSLGMISQVYNTEITNNTAAGEGGAIWAVDDLTMENVKVTGNTSGGKGFAVWLDDANFDGHSYFIGRIKIGGNTQITDNKGGDMYMGKEVAVVMTPAGLGKDAKINVTLDSGLLTNRVYGAYNYEGGNCVYTITYGDRSLTEPEYAEPVSEETVEPTEGTEGTEATEPKAENTLLYAGVGAFAIVIVAVAVIVILANKKKKAGKTAEEVSQD